MANSAAGFAAVAFDTRAKISTAFGGIDGCTAARIAAYVPVALCRNPPLSKYGIQSPHFSWISGGLILWSNYIDKVDYEKEE
jgi:hypothetical protein